MIDYDDINEGDEHYPNISRLSNCCGAPELGEFGICSTCGEHADFEEDTEDERF